MNHIQLDGSWNTALTVLRQQMGRQFTPDSLFAIASNSKLFLSLSVGLLIENKTLSEERGEKISWDTRAVDIFPQWGLMDKDMERLVNVQDMLSHRTGMPRHDQSGRPLEGGVSEMISNLRYLRPSAEIRETWQYNNLMYETLSYLPILLLGKSYESYIAEHLFQPLNMTGSVYSVAHAEASVNMAHGYMRSMRDEVTGVNGTLTPTVPYFFRPGGEQIWAGSGGVISSARDMSVWVAMLLGNGQHPFTNNTVVPNNLIKHVAEGVSVIDGTTSYPELGISVYGAGQQIYTYRGHQLIEHGGANPGFKSQVSRFPNDNLGIVVLSNDEEFGTMIHQIVIRRIVDHIFGLPPIDWKTRLEDERTKKLAERIAAALPRPHTPVPPTRCISSLADTVFAHPAYGTLRPCFVGPDAQSPSHECARVLEDDVVRRIIQTPFTKNSTIEEVRAIPTVIIPFKGFFATHVLLRHFTGNIFNGSVIWSNQATREEEGYGNGGDLIIGFDDRFEVEWVHESESSEQGLAFKGGFWGKGKQAKELAGSGKDSAEVWFAEL
ncbi:beta-lactamase/transpeptidase-like protein [Rhodocollybia butyracea]|uniref:Beta-lactamase/transpeptidase-like protein n=1 Tax=Rhodocollybia butyracea TaxID=206335 RepID=A0A9P5Q472_9AGAR|nr:beta-lactamase/transpeptidase-like protein [Rhodocollybia butyracea]